MTSSYSLAGIIVDRYDDIKNRLIALAEAQWGDSVDTGVDSDDDAWLGHKINNVSLLLSEINEVVQSLYDGMNIVNATGTHLANLVALIGLSRQSAAYSTATLTLTADRATTVPAGTRYATAADVVFETDVALVFTAAGSSTVAATCTVAGPFAAAAATITTIKDSVYGITACTNVAAATPGRYRETDAQLKVRHTTAVSTSGESDAASIYEAVSAVTGVSSTYVFDNDTDAAIGSVPAKTIHVSTIGGDVDDVAEAINLAKTASVPTYGATATVVYDDTTRQAKTINHDRGAEVLVYIEVGYTEDATFPDDGESQIETQLIAHFSSFELNDDVIYDKLKRPIYAVEGFTLDTLKIGTAPGPVGVTDLAMTALQKPTVSAASITFA
jgi:uncharacterized phage protein gp47/JayE